MNAKVQAPTLIEQPVYLDETLFARARSLWRADFLSPKDLVRRAALLALLYGVVSAFGLREFTSILNGTMGSVALGWHLSAFFGLLYIISYLAFVLGTPTLLIAAGILFLWKRLVK
jgi:hypothetical protein